MNMHNGPSSEAMAWHNQCVGLHNPGRGDEMDPNPEFDLRTIGLRNAAEANAKAMAIDAALARSSNKAAATIPPAKSVSSTRKAP